MASPEPARRPRFLLAAVLFVLTFVSSTTLGAVVYLGSRTDVTTELIPLLSWATFRGVWSDPALVGLGLRFSLPLLFILMCHELGHYLACRYYGIRSTLPYFLPSPFFIGTLGAFIRIRSRIPGKKELFDVGVAGPLAGFAALLPFLFLGIFWSTPAEVATASQADATAYLYVPGGNLAIAGLSWLFYGPLPPEMVLNPHPFALAAWVGLLATALNLIPLGQLDGGHILYALVGSKQQRLAWPLWLALLLLSLYWRGWLVWCLLLLVIGLRHPPVAGEGIPLDRPRRRLALVALLLLLVSFSPRPLRMLLIRDTPRSVVAAADAPVAGPAVASAGIAAPPALSERRGKK